MMGNFYDTPTHPKARKEHRCIYCYGPILVGETYVQQTGFFEGKPFRNKFHNECFDACFDEDGEEFMPGSADYPPRVVAIVDARKSAALAQGGKP